jgi:hypothetical protein
MTIFVYPSVSVCLSVHPRQIFQTYEAYETTLLSVSVPAINYC